MNPLPNTIPVRITGTLQLVVKTAEEAPNFVSVTIQRVNSDLPIPVDFFLSVDQVIAEDLADQDIKVRKSTAYGNPPLLLRIKVRGEHSNDELRTVIAAILNDNRPQLKAEIDKHDAEYKAEAAQSPTPGKSKPSCAEAEDAQRAILIVLVKLQIDFPEKSELEKKILNAEAVALEIAEKFVTVHTVHPEEKMLRTWVHNTLRHYPPVQTWINGIEARHQVVVGEIADVLREIYPEKGSSGHHH